MFNVNLYKITVLLFIVPFITNCGVNSGLGSDNVESYCTLASYDSSLHINIAQDYTSYEYLAYAVNSDELIFDDCSEEGQYFNDFYGTSIAPSFPYNPIVNNEALNFNIRPYSKLYKSYFNENYEGEPLSREINITIYSRSSCDVPLEIVDTFNGHIDWTNNNPKGNSCIGHSFSGRVNL